MIAARIYTPATDASCLVCGFGASAHSHAPACPVTADSLTFDQILDAVTAGVVPYLTGWNALGDPDETTRRAREQIAAALNARTTA